MVKFILIDVLLISQEGLEEELIFIIFCHPFFQAFWLTFFHLFLVELFIIKVFFILIIFFSYASQIKF